MTCFKSTVSGPWPSSHTISALVWMSWNVANWQRFFPKNNRDLFGKGGKINTPSVDDRSTAILGPLALLSVQSIKGPREMSTWRKAMRSLIKQSSTYSKKVHIKKNNTQKSPTLEQRDLCKCALGYNLCTLKTCSKSLHSFFTQNQPYFGTRLRQIKTIHEKILPLLSFCEVIW